MAEVEPGREIAEHVHDDEPQFRFVAAGSLILNDVLYEKGDWVVVPIGVPYTIRTETGYSTVAGYGMSCSFSAVGGHWLDNKSFKADAVNGAA